MGRSSSTPPRRPDSGPWDLEDLYTVTANLAGIPAISVPCGLTAAGLPVGLHLQAPALEEDRLLRAAHRYQTATDWHRKVPAL